MSPENISNWRADWAWGLPLIVLTVMMHAAGLGLIKRRADKVMPFIFRHQALSIGGVTLSSTLLHGLEASIWALAFLALKAVPDKMSAALYSMNALTAFGHTDLKLERPWQLLGAIEALNGWILFGLSSAYLSPWSSTSGRTLDRAPHRRTDQRVVDDRARIVGP